jgi:tetratricopeptide (TPR) repeat protein
MVAERGETGELPETVQGIIAARLDALAPDEKDLLQTAAVVGRQFWLGALLAVNGVDRDRAEHLLHALQRKEFVRRERRSSVAGETEFLFAHVLVRDVAYGQIPRADRAGKHQAAAAWLEALAPDHAEGRADLLAHHYVAALELARATGTDAPELAVAAREALRDAGARAYALGAFAASARVYGQALDIWPEEDAERPVVVLRHAEALFYWGGRVELTQVADAALALAVQGELALAAQAEIIAAVAAWWDGRGDVSDAHAARALELVRDSPPSAEKATVLVERARLLMVASRAEEALEVGRDGLEIAERLGLDHITASALVTLGTARGMLHGGEDEGKRELERGIELAARNNAVQQLQRGYVNLAEVYWRHDQLDDAAELLREARRAGREFGDPYLQRWLDTEQSEVAYLMGQWSEAEEQANAFVADVEAGLPYTTESIARCVRTEIWRARGDVPAAAAEAERALAAAREVGDPQNVGPALVVLAWARLDEGRDEEATALVEELLASVSDDGGFGYFRWIVDSAWLARAVGRVDDWRACATNELPSRYLDAGEAVARGDDELAAELLEAKGHVTEAAYARLRAAEHLVAEGRRAEADPQLHAALAFYRSVGAAAFVARGEALLAESA